MSRLRVSSVGQVSKVELDGVDISRSLLGVTIRYAGGSAPVAELEVLAYEEAGSDSENACVVVPADTAALLEKLGWTPPTDQTGKGTDR